MLTPAQQLSEYAHALRYNDIPNDVRNLAVRCLADVLGICLADQDMPFARVVTDLVTEWGGAPESTVIGSGARVPAPNAILANGNLAHGIDFDNTHGEGRVHSAACIVPTALAVAEKVGSGGRALVEAIVAGVEVQTRIGSAASSQFHFRGFHPTFVSGCFATAITAGKLLDLSVEQLTHALGICGTQAAGTFEWLADGSWSKRFGPGWAGHGGTIAALMARRGYTGPPTIFEGKLGFYRSHVGEGNYSIERLVRGLGSEWETRKLQFKRYPCCHALHGFINAALTLRRDYGFGPDDIAEVECLIQPHQIQNVCEPRAVRVAPTSTYVALFSLFYTVACAFVRGAVGLDDFTDESIRDPEVLKLAERVRYTIYQYAAWNPSYPGIVVARLRDGRELRREYEGDLQNPMTDDEIAEKFRRNARRSLPADQVERLQGALVHLPSAATVSGLMALTVAGR